VKGHQGKFSGRSIDRWFFMDEYVVEYAPDGEHYSVSKKGRVGEMWDYFVADRDIRMALILAPSSKFRLRNMITGETIGVLQFDNEKKEFLHLKE